MTKKEEQEFLDLIKYGDGNNYEVLGLTPYSDFNKENYEERFCYLKDEVSNPEIRNNGFKHLHIAKATLSQNAKKHLYNFNLRRKLKRKLIELIVFAVTATYTLTTNERKQLEIFGKKYGFTLIEINNIIEEQRKIYNFSDVID